MSNAQRHIIGKILVEVETQQSTEVWGIQEELSQLLQQVAIPQIEQLFDSWVGTDEVVRLDQLVIELPAIAPHDLADEFVPKLLTALRQAFDDLPRPMAEDIRQPFTNTPSFAIADLPSTLSESETLLLAQAPPEADWEVLLYFLEYGRLPWWQPSEPLSEWVLRWETVIQSDTRWRAALQQLLSSQPLARQRLVLQLPGSFFQQLIMQMQPTWTGFQGLLDVAKALMGSLNLDDRTTHYLEQQAWVFLFAEIQTNPSISAPLPARPWVQTWLPLLCHAAIAAGTTHQQVRNLIAAGSFTETALWLEVMDQIVLPEASAPVERSPASSELTLAEQSAVSEQIVDREMIAPVDPRIDPGLTDATEEIAPLDQPIASEQTTEGPETTSSEPFRLAERTTAPEQVVLSEQATTGEQPTEANTIAQSDQLIRSELVPATEAIAPSQPSTASEQTSRSDAIIPVNQPTSSDSLILPQQIPSQQTAEVNVLASSELSTSPEQTTTNDSSSPSGQSTEAEQTTEVDSLALSNQSTPAERISDSAELAPTESSDRLEQPSQPTEIAPVEIAPVDTPVLLDRMDGTDAIAPSDQSIASSQAAEPTEIAPLQPLTASEPASSTAAIAATGQPSGAEPVIETEAIAAAEQPSPLARPPATESIAQSEQSMTGAQSTEAEAIPAAEPLAPSEQNPASRSLTAAERSTGSEPMPSIDASSRLEGTDPPDAIAPLDQSTASQPTPPAAAIASSDEFIDAAQTSDVDLISEGATSSDAPTLDASADSTAEHESPSEGLHPLMANPPRYTVYVSLSPAERADGIYLNQAGLVLLHPFLTYYFEAVGLISDNAFRHEYAQQIAIALLHYLATGETIAPEYALVLPKLLCGWPLNDPVMGGLELPAAALTEAENLLETVIQYWDVLKNTSPDGLRQGFLQRQGKLTRVETGGWKLRVEQQSIDILLSRLPWGVSMVKLPWMAEVLVVEWT